MGRPAIKDCIEHYNNPVPGDLWHEMLVMQFIVLKVTGPNSIVIAKKDMSYTDGQCFTLWKAEEITRDEFRKLITYTGVKCKDEDMKFLCYVMPESKTAKKMVKEWEEDHNGEYLSLSEREEAVKHKPRVRSMLFDKVGFTITGVLENVKSNSIVDVSATAFFKYKGYHISFTTITSASNKDPRLVVVWEGELHERLVTVTDTVEEAIDYINKL